MTDPKGREKRSIQNVLINRPLQREFTLVMLGIMMSAAFAVGMVIHFTLSHLTEFAPNTISRITLERMVFDANSQLVVSAILIIFIAVIATGSFGIFFLHRVAGPVYRFRQVLSKIGSGQIPGEVHLRKKDFFKETAEEINRVIQLLKELEGISKKMDQVVTQLPKEALTEDLNARIKDIHTTLAQLHKFD